MIAASSALTKKEIKSATALNESTLWFRLRGSRPWGKYLLDEKQNNGITNTQKLQIKTLSSSSYIIYTTE